MSEREWIWLVAAVGGVAIFLGKWAFGQVWKEIDNLRRHIERLYDKLEK